MADSHAHIQDGVQQYGVSLLAPLAEGERALDMCAAPGGKSRSFLYHHPQTSLLALDVNPKRAADMARKDGRLADVAHQVTTIHCADNPRLPPACDHGTAM